MPHDRCYATGEPLLPPVPEPPATTGPRSRLSTSNRPQWSDKTPELAQHNRLPCRSDAAGLRALCRWLRRAAVLGTRAPAIAGIRGNNWMSGAAVFAPIPASRIRHKVEITDPREMPWRDGSSMDDEAWREEIADGLIARLRAQGEMVEAKTNYTDHYVEINKLFDKAAGTDERLHLAREYGSPALAEWARSELCNAT